MNLSRRATAAWTCLLLVSNLLLFAWLFRAVSPRQFLTGIYFSHDETPWVYGLPAALLAVCALAAYLKIRKPSVASNILRRVPKLGRMLLVVFFAILILQLATGNLLWPNLISAMGGLFICVLCVMAGEAWLLPLWPLRIDSRAFNSRAELWALSGAAGLGALSTLVFLSGIVGISPSGTVLAAMVLGALLSKSWRAKTHTNTATQVAQFFEMKSALAIGATLFVLLLLLAHLPLLWAAPTDYDVLEYHLAAPAQYLEHGKISFLHENIYATFPENGEMLYLFAMQLGGGRFRALPAAHALLLSAWVLSVLGVYALAKRLAQSIPVWGEEAAGTAPAIAALLYALIPLGSQLAADFYVEHFQALFHVCALICACAFLKELNIRAFFQLRPGAEMFEQNAGALPRWLLAAGMFAGLACGTKYTGLLFTLAPLLIFIPLGCLLLGSAREAFGALWRIALPALVLFSPWCVRNFFAAGDPLYPLGFVMQRRAIGASGIPDKLDHFEAAHRAGENSWGALLSALRQLMPGLHAAPHLDEVECGPQLLCFAAPGAACISSPETWFVAGVFVLDFALWFLFSHRLNRFFYPQLSALAALGGLGAAGVWRIRPLRKVCVMLLACSVLLIAPLQMLWTWLYTSREAPGRSALEEAGEQFKNFGAAQSFEGVRAGAALESRAKVLFVGEARTFYCERTPQYSVVFNTSLLEKVLRETQAADELREKLKAAGITHLYFNYGEWMRLDTTYALTSEPGEKSWKPALWSPERSQAMTEFLRTGQLLNYGKLFPENTFAAYLRLSLEDYALLEQFISRHTRRVWPADGTPFGVCELREIN